jgi:hypothetical protein
MDSLMAEVKNEMEKQRILQKVVGEAIGCKNISNNLNNKEQMAFIHFVKLISIVYSRKTKNFRQNMIKEFINATPRDENIRVALEWASQTGNKDLQKVAIKKCKSINDSHKQLAKVYELFIKRNEYSVGRIEFNFEMERIRNSTVSRKETKSLLNIGKLYYYSESGNHKGVLEEGEFIEIKQIRPDYLRTSFFLRIMEHKARALLKYENNSQKAAEILYEILQYDCNLYTFSNVNALSLLAELNSLNNYETAFRYIKEAILLSSSIEDKKSYLRQRRMLESTHDFIKLYHGNYKDLYLTDIAERVYYLVQQNNETADREALILLNELESKNKGLSPFQMYYKGMLTKDKGYLIDSQREFHKAGDFFYSRLPSNLLKKF